jgi:GTP pyrophosphokinase
LHSKEQKSTRWERLVEATAFAMNIHADQVRKGSDTPYISHLLGVASLVLEFGGDEDQAIAGLLHDAIEDQGAEQEPIILEQFGVRVAAIVRGCTDADTLPKPPWRARKEAYIKHLETAGPDIWLVSAADKLYNARAIVTDLRAIGDAMFTRFTGGKEGTLWYYRNLTEVFLRVAPGSLSDELSAAVGEMERLANGVKH